MTIKSLSHSSLTDNLFYRSMLAGNTAYEPVPDGSFHLLETYTLPSAQSSIVFSSVNSYTNYQHLQLRLIARSNDAGSPNARDLRIRLNGVTTASYSSHFMRGDGAGIYSSGYTTSTSDAIFGSALLPRPDNPSDQFGVAVIDILDFLETTKYKTVKILAGVKPNGEDQVWLGSGSYLSNDAITSITLFANSGSFDGSTTCSLYGIRSV